MAGLAARACVVFLRRPKAVAKAFRGPALWRTSPTTQARCIGTTKVSGRSHVMNPDEDLAELTNEEWAKRLTPEQYFVCRERGTEPPFSGQYYSHAAEGLYHCICCGVELFSSKSKYDSGSGWPSFFDAYKAENGDEQNGNVLRRTDVSHGMVRTEVMCKKCNSHLGHVFDDGPQPTGERFCVNSVSLKFIPKKLAK